MINRHNVIRPHRRLAPLAAIAVAALLGAVAVPASLQQIPAQGAAPWTRWAHLVGVSGGPRSATRAAQVIAAVVDITAVYPRQSAVGAGTGIVVDPDGLVLTNNHVVAAAATISATDVGNHRRYAASVAGRDPIHDIALLRLHNATGLIAAPLGDSSGVAVGDAIIALGNADGRGGRPSRVTGAVTALNQTVTAANDLTSRAERLYDLIEVSARLRPGDSGGPLINSTGQVIGVDTAAGGAPGEPHGYAIPIDDALQISRQWS